jgi:hypothetical protein
MWVTAVGAQEEELYSKLLHAMSEVPIETGGRLLPDISASVCPLVSVEKLELLNEAMPILVVRNKGLEEHASGFPEGTSHWIILDEWLGPLERLSLAINLDRAEFCRAFAGALMQEEPNPDLIGSTQLP